MYSISHHKPVSEESIPAYSTVISNTLVLNVTRSKIDLYI